MSDHVVKSTCELSAYVTAGVMADSERDSASSSGGDEDSRSGLHSPSASEDSVEVQVTPISLRNKRKLAEPRKIQEPCTAPLKKRRFHQIEETVVDDESRPISTPSPFRPWIIPCTSNETSKTSTTTSTMTPTVSDTTTTTSTTTSTTPSTNTASEEIKLLTETVRRNQEEMSIHVNHTMDKTTIRRLQKTLQRLEENTSHNRSAVLSRRESRHRLESPIPPASPVSLKAHPRLQEEPLSLVMRDEAPRVPSHPAVSGSYEKSPSYMMEHLLASSSSTTTTTATTTSPLQSHHNHRDHLSPPQGGGPHQRLHAAPTAGVVSSASSSSSPSHASSSRHLHQNNGGGQQRNYKNMTRERRIEANARERTRVHTISAAFDTLRRAIPAYSHNQKLSKLSVLRIACSYIVTLSKICEKLEGDAASGASLAACVDQVSRTIQTEGKLRKRKDD